MRTSDVIRTVGGSLAVYFVVAACSGSGRVPSASADDSASGTRLKVQRYVGSDGSSIVAGLYDTMLGVSCGYGLASDGSIRCLPIGGEFTPAISGPFFYSDSACSAPIVFPGGSADGSNCSVATYTLVSLTCGNEVHQATAYSGSLYTNGSGAASRRPRPPRWARRRT
jgi:hypothetical protein